MPIIAIFPITNMPSRLAKIKTGTIAELPFERQASNDNLVAKYINQFTRDRKVNQVAWNFRASS